MKRMMCFLLVFVMIFLLTACGPTEKDKLLGTWKGEVDMTHLFNESIATEGGEDVSAYMEIQDFTLVIALNFYEDDTYSMVVDEDALMVTVEGAKDDLKAGLERYLMETVSAALGVEMPIEELLEYAGISMDEITDGIFTQELIDEMVDGINSAGHFLAEEGKLYLSGGLGYEIDKSDCESYSLDGDVLSLVEFISREEVDEFTKALYPMEFHKAS